MFTLRDISNQIGGTLVGNPELLVAGPSEPKFASEQQLAMALSNKYINEIGLGRAKAALFTKQVDWRALKLEGAIFLNKGKTALYEVNRVFHSPPKCGEGVSRSALLDDSAKIGKNVTIDPYVVIGKKVKISNNVVIHSFSHLENVKIENNVVIGPYARLRPGTILKSGSKVGNFVEIKKSVIGKKSKVNHLSYVGDSSLGKNVNVGAGTITCNYDGVKKSKTKIKDNAFIGSNSSLIAPVTIEKNSIVGAGSAITKNVRANSLGLTRNTQIEIKNYKRKK